MADQYTLGSHQKKRAQLAAIVSLTAPFMRTMKSLLPKNDCIINRLLRFAFPIHGDWKIQMLPGIRQRCAKHLLKSVCEQDQCGTNGQQHLELTSKDPGDRGHNKQVSTVDGLGTRSQRCISFILKFGRYQYICRRQAQNQGTGKC